MLSLCLIQFVDVLGVTVVVTTLPVMLKDLGAPASAGSLIAAGYAMCFGGLLMTGARLGDRFGYRRTILAGLLLFAVAAGVGASADSVAVLTVARCMQGAAAAASVPSALRLLTTISAEGAQRQRAIAIWSAAGAAAGASGFVIGGVVTDVLGWRAVFWAWLPLAAGLGVAIVLAVPPDRGRNRSLPLNLAGSIMFTVVVMLFVLATTLLTVPGGRSIGVILLAGAAVLTPVFVVVDQRSDAPMLPRFVLREETLRLGTIAALLNTFTTSSAITLAALYLQSTLHRSPLVAAVMLLPFSLGVITGAALAAPSKPTHYPKRRVIAGGLSQRSPSAMRLLSQPPPARGPYRWPSPLAAPASASPRWPPPAWVPPSRSVRAQLHPESAHRCEPAPRWALRSYSSSLLSAPACQRPTHPPHLSLGGSPRSSVSPGRACSHSEAASRGNRTPLPVSFAGVHDLQARRPVRRRPLDRLPSRRDRAGASARTAVRLIALAAQQVTEVSRRGGPCGTLPSLGSGRLVCPVPEPVRHGEHRTWPDGSAAPLLGRAKALRAEGWETGAAELFRYGDADPRGRSKPAAAASRRHRGRFGRRRCPH